MAGKLGLRQETLQQATGTEGWASNYLSKYETEKAN